MATLDEQYLLLGRILLDPDFREAFFKNPEGEAGKLGIDLSETQSEGARNVKAEDVNALAEELYALMGIARPPIWP